MGKQMFRAIFRKALRYLTTAVGFASPKCTSSTPFLQNLYMEHGVLLGFFFPSDALLLIRDQTDEQGARCWQNCACNAPAAGRLLPASVPAVPGPGSPKLPRSSGQVWVFTLCFKFLNQAVLGTRVQAPGPPSLGVAGLVGTSSD